MLVIDQFSTTIRNYMGEVYPDSISVGLRGFSGLIGTDGQPSNKIITMTLVPSSSRS